MATGERLFTKWGFRDVLALGAADVLQPDIAHCGGIWEGRKIAAAAEDVVRRGGAAQPLLLAADEGQHPTRLRDPELHDPGVPGRPPAGGGAPLRGALHLAARRLGRAAGRAGLGIELDWDAIRAHEQLPYTRTYQPSLWHVDGSVADW